MLPYAINLYCQLESLAENEEKQKHTCTALNRNCLSMIALCIHQKMRDEKTKNRKKKIIFLR